MMDNSEEKIRRARAVGLNNLVCKAFRKLSDQAAEQLTSFPIHPNVITISSVFFNVLGALLATLGTYFGFLGCSVFFLLAWFLDFLDGSVAQRKNLATRFGGYLDVFCDDIRGLLWSTGLTIGFLEAGKTGLVLLVPILIYGGDVVIEHTLTRYRKAFIDPQPQEADLESTFRRSFLLQLGRNLLPPFFWRTTLFPAFAFFNLAIPFLSAYAVYTLILMAAFSFKVGFDLHREEQKH